jgi:hypothetical protein
MDFVKYNVQIKTNNGITAIVPALPVPPDVAEKG